MKLEINIEEIVESKIKESGILNYKIIVKKKHDNDYFLLCDTGNYYIWVSIKDPCNLSNLPESSEIIDSLVICLFEGELIYGFNNPKELIEFMSEEIDKDLPIGHYANMVNDLP